MTVTNPFAGPESPAGIYDSWYVTRTGRRYDFLEKRTVLNLLKSIPHTGDLLEAGMGTGWWTRFFSSLGFRVFALDISEEMIRQARARKIPRSHLIRADAKTLPFENHRFSVSCVITALEFCQDPRRVLQEMVRCTRPGGLLIAGVLNSRAPVNRKRAAGRKPAFRNAEFLSQDQLFRLLSAFGKPVILPCAFPVSLKIPGFLSGLSDDLLRATKRKTGAFLAGAVTVNL